MLFRLIGWGLRIWGCLFVLYWVIIVGIATVIIITTSLRENKHPPAVKTASTEFHPSKRATPGSTYR